MSTTLIRRANRVARPYRGGNRATIAVNTYRLVPFSLRPMPSSGLRACWSRMAASKRRFRSAELPLLAACCPMELPLPVVRRQNLSVKGVGWLLTRSGPSRMSALGQVNGDFATLPNAPHRSAALTVVTVAHRRHSQWFCPTQSRPRYRYGNRGSTPGQKWEGVPTWAHRIVGPTLRV
jgi:hypothetical protein